MTSAEYWALRSVKEREALINNSIKKVEKQLKWQYRRAEKEIEAKMVALYDKILLEAGTDNELISHLYKYNRYSDLIDNLNDELKKLGSKEKTILSKELKDLYKENAAIIGEQIGYSTYVDDKKVRKIINEIWCSDGKNWSDRIWTHKAQLVQTLSNGLVDCVATGASYTKLTKMIMDRFGASYSNANRLARTELSHIYNRSAVDKYKEAGIKQYRYLTAQDERTCEKCAPLNMKIFNIENAQTSVNFPPLHTNCRCTILAVVDE